MTLRKHESNSPMTVTNYFYVYRKKSESSDTLLIEHKHYKTQTARKNDGKRYINAAVNQR